MKKIYFLILILIIQIISTFNVFAATKKISNVEVETNKDGISHFVGTIEGDADSSNLLVKIYNSKNFEYFNFVTVEDNKFEFYYKPSSNSKVKDGDTLVLKISGDLTYEKEFYYSSKYSDSSEEYVKEITDLLKNYTIYYDEKNTQKLKFEIDFKQTDYIEIYLKGINFKESDNIWKLKDDESWNVYLNTIIKKVKDIVDKDVWIYVYDSEDEELQVYPEKQPEKFYEYITNEVLQDIISDYNSFNYNGNNYSFTFSLLNEGKTNYIKIKAKSEYSKKDTEWKNLSKTKLESFSEKIAKKINDKYNANIDILYYDSNNSLLTSYSYDYYDESINDTNKEEVNTEFIPWDKNKATGLVLMLRVTDYGENSLKLNPTINESTKDGLYSYEINLDDSESVENIIENLRNDKQKIVYISEETDSSNIDFNIDSNIVELFKDNKCLFIFDTSNYKIEMDFTDFKKTGDISIHTTDAQFEESGDYSKPISLKITVNGNEASSYFKKGIKCLLHYDSEKTRNISDLRSVNIYDSTSTMYNTTASTKEKGFIFKYKNESIYYAKENQYVFDDINLDDVKYKKYAQLVSSKGIIPGINNGKFNPNQELTRGDFIYYIANKMGVSSNTNHFSDLDSSYSYYKQVNGVYELGVLPSSYKNNISINTPITIEEIIFITIRCYEINDENDQNIQTASLLYTDKNDISIWATPKISKAVKLNMIPSDGQLLPKDIAKKIDAAEIIYGLLVSEKIF